MPMPNVVRETGAEGSHDGVEKKSVGSPGWAATAIPSPTPRSLPWRQRRTPQKAMGMGEDLPPR